MFFSPSCTVARHDTIRVSEPSGLEPIIKRTSLCVEKQITFSSIRRVSPEAPGISGNNKPSGYCQHLDETDRTIDKNDDRFWSVLSRRGNERKDLIPGGLPLYCCANRMLWWLSVKAIHWKACIKWFVFIVRLETGWIGWKQWVGGGSLFSIFMVFICG